MTHQEEYLEQLEDARWKAKRMEILKRDSHKCKDCGAHGFGDGSVILQAHHTYYKTNLKAWEYPNESLVTLCRLCHRDRHNLPTIPLGSHGYKSIGEIFESMDLAAELAHEKRMASCHE